MDYIVTENPPVAFIQETWLTDPKNHTTAIIKAHGYDIHHFHRPSTRGGGVAILYKSGSMKVVKLFISNVPTFESVSLKIKLPNKKSLLCSCIYRTGPLSSFIHDFELFLSDLITKSEQILVCGDFNIHMDGSSKEQNELDKVISDFGLYQLSNGPTHISGHTLDLVIASHNIIKENKVTSSHNSEDFPTCDHFCLSFNLNITTLPSDDMKKISFRNIRNIKEENFRSDIYDTLSKITGSDKSFAEIINIYNSTVSTTLDKHAPLMIKWIRDIPDSKWFDSSYKAARARRRQAEKEWKRTMSEKDRLNFVYLRSFCNELANKKKREYFRNHFEKYNYSQKSLFQFVHTFLDSEKSLTLPTSDCLQETVDNFNSYFTEKVENIRKSFPPNKEITAKCQSLPCKILENFEPATLQEITDILSETDLKSCDLDPIPANLMAENLDLFVPSLCHIVNASLAEGSIDNLKSAHLIPLIKGSSLDINGLKNYRPVSNLAFVGKIIEKVVQRRLNNHLSKNNLSIDNQSAYKKHFSTETLLIRVVNDLLIACDENKATVVMLLDLSAAFDTVDHQKLLIILEQEIGITGTALRWFKNYLSGRCQRVKIGETESIEIIIRFGVPQGSVLGPILFNIYIRSIYNTIKSILFNVHGFADDHQVFKSFQPENEYQILANDLPLCFRAINEWMSSHYLQLNPGKTEIIVFGSNTTLSKLQIQGSFITPETCVRFVSTAKNLGFHLDSSLTFSPQIDKLKVKCLHSLRLLSKMKSFLSIKQKQQLVQAVVISSIDYCNSLYYGIHSCNLRTLQNIQNRACAFILSLKRRDPKTEHLKSLHWLKVPERIEFKILLTVFKILNGAAPNYLIHLVSYNNISGSRTPSLKSYVPKTRMGCRAFVCYAPKLWNELPLDVKSCCSMKEFKTKLKTFLFNRSYNNS